MKKIYCVRHGRTAWNAVGRFQGTIDNPLDDVGRAQVTTTAMALADVHFSRAVGSDLTRAVETMAILLAGRDLVATFDRGWRERDFGAWEGLTWSEITERTPELAAAIAIDVRSFRPPGGEDFEAVKRRVADAFDRASAGVNDGEVALVVAHAGVFHALLDALFGAAREATAIAPAGVFILEIDAGIQHLVMADGIGA